VVPLGEHLRADEQPHLATRHAVERGLERAALAHGIAVDALERHVREQARECFLDALGALADRLRCVAAGRAEFRDALLGATVVAVQAPVAPVHGEPCIAARAGRRPAAGRAEQRRCVATPVQVQQHLSAGIEVALDRQHGRRRDALRGGVPAQVDQVDRGRLRATGAARQAE